MYLMGSQELLLVNTHEVFQICGKSMLLTHLMLKKVNPIYPALPLQIKRLFL